MKEKVLFSVFLSLLMLLAISPRVSVEAATPERFPLYAGQHTLVGEVLVWNDGENLHVKYTITESGWYLVETHLEVATNLGDIPQTRNGNPIPGHFTYKNESHTFGTTEYTYTLPLDGGEILYIAAHAVVMNLIGDGSSWQWATEVIDYKQGTLKDGNPITDPARMDPSTTLGDPDDSFYSLGFVNESRGDGWIELGFGYPVYNGPGADIAIREITYGRPNYPEEKADVYVWPLGGSDWVYAGTASNKNEYSYIEIPDYIMYVEKIKLVDSTDKSLHSNNADGFDVDAVGVRYLYLGEETAWAGGVEFPGKNWARYFNYTVQETSE
ncbi:hypothetical protein [Thermococcus sp. PK]|uniref:hypothetical protein n=1 Tax=Thermococcus sp. PK TaxID=913025 RepID=UPI0005B2BD65|nr:hypothetical protein [Thermococcus sp. PK]